MKWSTSPPALLGVSVALVVLAAAASWSTDATSGVADLSFYDVAGTILILPLLVSAWVLTVRRRYHAAARLAAAAGTLAAMLALYAYQWSATGYAHRSAIAPTASIVAAVLFALTAAISLVLAPRRLGADGFLVIGTALSVVALLVAIFVLLFIVSCTVGGQCPGSG